MIGIADLPIPALMRKIGSTGFNMSDDVGIGVGLNTTTNAARGGLIWLSATSRLVLRTVAKSGATASNDLYLRTGDSGSGVTGDINVATGATSTAASRGSLLFDGKVMRTPAIDLTNTLAMSTGGPPLFLGFVVASGSTALDATVVRAMRVLDAWYIKGTTTGGLTDQIDLRNSNNIICSFQLNTIADQSIVRCTSINYSGGIFAPGDTIRITRTLTTNNGGILCISAIPLGV